MMTSKRINNLNLSSSPGGKDEDKPIILVSEKEEDDEPLLGIVNMAGLSTS